MSGPLTSQFPVTSTMVGGVYNLTTPTPADAEGCALQLDASGNLKVTSSGGGGGAGSAYLSFTGALTGSPAIQVKASPGSVYGWDIFNSAVGAGFAYLQFFNALVANITVGTTAPLFTIGIANNLSTAGGNGSVVLSNSGGIIFTTAIAVAATTTRVNGTGPATPLDVNLWYL